MEKCRRMKRPQFTSKNWIYSWLWKSSKTRQQSYRSESFAMKKDISMSGSTVKNHISLKTGFGYSAIRRKSFLSWFQACQRVRPSGSDSSTSRTLSRQESHCSTSFSSSSSSPTVKSSGNETREREDRIESDISPVTVPTKDDDRSGQPVVNQANKIPKTHKKEPQIDRGNPLYSEIPEWLQEIREK